MRLKGNAGKERREKREEEEEQKDKGLRKRDSKEN